jgi:hypothetical protein
MTRSPKYPIAAPEELAPEERKHAASEKPPADLYYAPSFKFRHEVREPLESSEAAYRRAYPHFFRAGPSRARRRHATRNG